MKMNEKPYVNYIPDMDSQSKAAKEFIQYYTTLRTSLEEPDCTLEEDRRLFEKWGDLGAEPREVDYIEFDADGVTCMWALPKERSDDRILICCHGGGYTYGSMYSHRKAYAHMAKKIGCRGLLVNYRNTPENKWPAPLEDVVTVYKWLLKSGYKPEHIAITGDSCGGALSVSTTLTILEEGLPMLAAVMPICPWFDLMGTTPRYETNDKDALNPRSSIQAYGNVLKNAGTDIEDPHLAPMYLKTMKGFPPVYIQVGGDENMVDEAVIVADTAHDSGVDVRVDIVGHMQHGFHQLAGNCKDADAAIERYAEWVRPLLGL